MARRVTSEYARMRPLLQRDKGATTIVRQVTTSGAGGGSVGDLSWVVPQGRMLYGADGITIDGATSGDLSEDRTIGLSGQHDILSKHSVTGGAALDVIGLSAAATLARLSPSADPTAAALLRSDATGGLGLQKLTVKEVITRDADGARNLLLNPVATGSVLVKDGRTVRSETFTPATFPIGGWGIEAITGTLNRLAINKIVADELRVKIFVADETRVDRGVLYVTKGYGILAQAFTTPGAINGTAYIYFENSPNLAGALFSNNDWVAIQLADFSAGANLAWTWGRVTGYSQTRAPGTNNDDDPGEQRWTFTLKYGDLNQTFSSGSFVLGWGQPGQGYITLDAVQAGVSPAVAVHVWGLDSNGDPDSAATPYGVATSGKPDIDNHPTKAVMGLLWSSLDNTLTPSGWGFYSDNAFLRGALRSTNARLDDEGLGIYASSSADFSEVDVVGFRKAGVSGEPLFAFMQGYWNSGDVKGRWRVSDSAGTRNASLFLESFAGGDDEARASIAARNTATDDYGALLELASTTTERGRAVLWAEHHIDLRVLDASASHTTHRINVQGNIVPYGSGDAVYDLGTATLRWRKVYADEIIATSIVGESIEMEGQEWTYGGDMVIDANDSANTTVYVRNDGGGVASLNVEGGITAAGAGSFGSATVSGALSVGGNLSISGTVDGVDVSSHAADVNAHHARDHALTGSTHTASGLTTGHVLRATSTTAFDFGTIVAAVVSDFAEAAQDAVGAILTDSASIDFTYNDTGAQISAAVIPGGVAHNSLAGLTTGDPHTQYVALATARTITAQHSFTPASAAAPFLLGANAQGQLVTGLRADQLNKSVVAGAGLTGGGALTSDRTLDVGAGAGITVNADSVQVRLAAASGLTLSGDTLAVLAANASLSVAAGGVNVNLAHNWAWTGTHQFSNTVQIQNNLTTRAILPEATDTYDIGSSLLLYRQSFISQMNAVIFAENTAQLIGGWFIVPKYAGKTGAVASAATQIDLGVGNAGIVNVGDWLLIRSHDTGGSVKAEYMTVGAFVSGTTWNVTRDVAGAHATDPVWADGTPYLLLGASGDGRIEFNASDTPRISLLRQGATYNAQSELLRIGDLNSSFAYSVQTWGMTIGRYGVASNAWLAFDEANGIRLGNNTTVVGWWRTDGSVQIGDSSNEHLLATPTALQFRDGSTVNGSLTGNAWVVGQAANNRARIEIDTTNGVRLIWRDGSGVDTTRVSLSTAGAATFVGDGSGLTSIDGGAIVTETITADKIGVGAITGNRLSLTTWLAIANSAFGQAGMQVQYNDGSPRFYVGNGSNRYFRFDGVNISWAAGNSSIDTSGNLTAVNGSFQFQQSGTTYLELSPAKGVDIAAGHGGTLDMSRAVTFRNPDAIFGGLYAYYTNDSYPLDDGVNHLRLAVGYDGNRLPEMQILAVGDTTYPGTMVLSARRGLNAVSIELDSADDRARIYGSYAEVYGNLWVESTAFVDSLQSDGGISTTDGVLTLGASSSSMARYKPSSGFTLADGAYIALPTFSGFVMVVCTSEVSTALYAASPSGVFLVGGAGNPDVYRTTSTSGYHSIHLSGGTLYLQNRRGGSRTYHLHMFGASTSFS